MVSKGGVFLSNHSGRYWIASILFAIAAIILFFSSLQKTGYGTIANIPSTIYAAACMVLCGINAVAAVLCSKMKELYDAIKDVSSDVVYNSPNNNNTYLPSKSDEKRTIQSNSTISQFDKMESFDANWKEIGNQHVKCPNCGDEMTIDYIRARKKCPNCGQEYNTQD